MKSYLIRSSLVIIAMGLASWSLLSAASNSCIKQLRYLMNSTKYRASIDILNKHLSGILIFKVQADSSVRTVFINEIGTTFFDMTIHDDSYRYHSVIKSLDKKSVKKTLAKDMGIILIRGLFKDQSTSSVSNGQKVIDLKLKTKGIVRYVADSDCHEVNRIENLHRDKKIITINQFYLKGQTMPDSIFVSHHKVHFNISLKQLYATE